MIKVIGIVIGLLVLGAGLHYLREEKENRESRKIYGALSAVGGVIAAVSAVLLIL